MFGESHSESPRQPSPWLSRSSGSSPSPLNLPSPNGSSSSPSTPTDPIKAFPTRRRSSLEEIDLFDGLADDLDGCAIDSAVQERDRSRDCVELEQVAVLEAKAAGLQPEVDHQGNIEYKLKIAMPTSIHRLEKLRTQLKWRLVEGGGTAIYELGLLDNGTLVGQTEEDMEQSLRTLAQMLAGLGGGRIQISRVIRIGPEAAPATSGDSPSPTPNTLFPSFDVLPDHDDISFVASGTPPVVDPVSGETSIFPPPRIRGPTPFPANRSHEQQAAFRRDKRDARRARRREAELVPAAGPRQHESGSSVSSSLGSSRSSTPASSEPPATPPIPIPTRSFQASYPAAIEPRAKPPKPPKPPRPTTARLRKVGVRPSVVGEPAAAAAAAATEDGQQGILSPKPQVAPVVGSFKPVLPQDCDEVRYVVEAIVRKAGVGTEAASVRRRRKSSAGSSSSGGCGRGVSGGSDEADRRADGESPARQDNSGLDPFGSRDADGDGDADDGSDCGSLLSGDEGWNYLDFDLSAAAAAATAAHAASQGTRV